MGEKIKGAATLAFGLVVVLGLLALPFVFIKGAIWASEHILPPLIAVGWFTLALVLFVLLPLSVFKRLRGYTGTGIYIASFVFGLICWLVGFVVTYMFWGIWAIVVGLLFLGGGVVPIGMLASSFKGEWATLGILVFLTIVTFGSRLLGLYIAERGE